METEHTFSEILMDIIMCSGLCLDSEFLIIIMRVELDFFLYEYNYVCLLVLAAQNPIMYLILF